MNKKMFFPLILISLFVNRESMKNGEGGRKKTGERK